MYLLLKLWFSIVMLYTLPKTNMAPENRPSQKGDFIFQPSIFRGKNVSFGEGSFPVV